jgi:hypothetical protein
LIPFRLNSTPELPVKNGSKPENQNNFSATKNDKSAMNAMCKMGFKSRAPQTPEIGIIMKRELCKSAVWGYVSIMSPQNNLFPATGRTPQPAQSCFSGLEEMIGKFTIKQMRRSPLSKTSA